MNYANFGKRLLAFLIDNMIVNIADWFLINYLGYFCTLLLVAAQWLYFALMESSEKQATLGKMAMGIIVTDLDGNRISFGRATGRFFSKIISCAILFIGYLMAAFTERKQALHDIMAGTLVLDGNAAAFAYAQPHPAPGYHAPRGNPAIYGLTGEFSGRTIPVDFRGIQFGRDASYCQVAFVQDTRGISRRHCTLNYDTTSGLFSLVDIGSTYGTFLESGMKIVQGQAVSLRPGDRFYLADRNNMFEVRV